MYAVDMLALRKEAPASFSNSIHIPPFEKDLKPIALLINRRSQGPGKISLGVQKVIILPEIIVP